MSFLTIRKSLVAALNIALSLGVGLKYLARLSCDEHLRVPTKVASIQNHLRHLDGVNLLLRVESLEISDLLSLNIFVSTALNDFVVEHNLWEEEFPADVRIKVGPSLLGANVETADQPMRVIEVGIVSILFVAEKAARIDHVVDGAFLVDLITDSAIHPDLVMKKALTERGEAGLVARDALDTASEAEIALIDSLNVVWFACFESLPQECLVSLKLLTIPIKDAHQYLKVD